jgi:type IV pilus assembly protein PilA
MRKIYHSSAFTLIELVVVMAIIAILALMTLPFFAGSAARTQVKESMELAVFAKDKVAIYYNTSETRQVPANNEAAKLPAPEKIASTYVASVTVVDGAVNMKFGNNAHLDLKDKTLTFRPAISVTPKDQPLVPITSSSWVCGNRAPPEKLEIVGTNVTNVPAKALPPECR